MKKIFGFLLLPVFAGCLTTNEVAISSWTIEYVGASNNPRAKQGVARVANVSVRAPWDHTSLAVRRADGSLAFDTYNEYAANPAYLIKGAVFDALKVNGPYEHVIGQSSIAIAPTAIEVLVTQLYLDCTKEDSRKATIELAIRCVHDRQIASVATGESSVEVEEGNFGAAFSKAATEALVKAIEKIR